MLIIQKIKQKLKKEEHKRLLSNFISLAFLQGANYILPLITFPYLVRVLGVEKFGLLAFAGATIAYFNILTDYGFNLTATRKVSIYRDNKEKLNEIFSSVMIIKLILMIISFILLLILIFSFNKFRQDYEIFILTFGVVIGQVLFPQWFFQGMERMKYITFLNILAKVIFTIAIFVFIHKSSDYWKVPLINSLGFIVAGILALYIIFKDFKIKFKLQTLNTLKTYFIDGWHLFLSQINISLFSNTNPIILGLLANDQAVGYYSIAEKTMRALAMFQTPITGSIFPYITKLIKENKQLAINKLKKIILYGSIIYTISIIFVIIFAPQIISILFGNSSLPAVNVLRIISIVPLTIFLNNIFGTQIMLNIGRKKEFANILFKGAILNILLCFVLTYYFSYIGTAISLLIVEFYIMIAMYFQVYKEFKIAKY